MKSILFVCTGNTCRSCMAEGILKDILKDKQDEVKIGSVGLFVGISKKASKNAIDVLKNEWDIDITNHKPRQLEKSDIEQFDLILTMTKVHKYAILNSYKEALGKVFTLKEYVKFSNINKDIIDPYGGSYEDYRLCANEIRDCILKLVEMQKGDLS